MSTVSPIGKYKAIQALALLIGYHTQLRRLKSLRFLYLYYNLLEGKLPSELGDLTALVHLHLFSNNFSGEVPSTLANLTNVESLYIGGNNFITNVPSDTIFNTEEAQRFLATLRPNQYRRPEKKTGGKFPKFPHVVATQLAIGFILVLLADSARRFSTWESYESMDPALGLHVISSTCWAVASSFLTLKGFNKYHRKVRAVASIFPLVMAVTASRLTLWSSSFSSPHTLFHALCNFVTVYLLGTGILTAATAR